MEKKQRAQGRPLFLSAAVVLSAMTFPAWSSEDQRKFDVDIESQVAGKSILALARAAGVQIMLDQESGNDVKLPALKGEHTLESALNALLKGSNLTYEFTADNRVIIKKNAIEAVESTPEEYEEVVVTGTRLKSIDPASPKVVITIEQIQRGGYSSVEDVLRTLPQNLNSAGGLAQQLRQTEFGASNNQFANTTLGNSGVNLRGLGSRSSLVLVNGRRKARSSQGLLDGFTDTSSIPISQIERIEIITDGASAIYGADAVAGVVDIILRKDYQGLDLSVRTERNSNNGAQDRLDMGYTFSWDGGRITTSVNTAQTKPDDQNRLTPVGPDGVGDFTSFGGLNLRRYGVGPAGEGSVVEAIPGSFGRFNAGDLLDGPNPWFPRDAVGNITGPRETGVPSVFDGQDLGSENERFSIRMDGEQELGDSHTLNFDVSYDRQEDKNALGFNSVVSFNNTNPANISGSLLVPRDGGGSQRLNGIRRFIRIDADNPSNTYGVPVLVGYDLALEGAAITAAQLPTGSELEGLSARIGVTGDLPFLESWNYDFDISLSREESAGRSYQADAHLPPFLVNPFVDAIAAEFDPFSGTPEAVARNVELLLAPLSTSISNGKNETVQFTAFVNGPVFDLPAGEAQLALGVEVRESNSESIISSFDSTGVLQRDPFVIGPNEESVEAAFAEISLPLLSDLPAIQSLTLTAAARYEKHERAGFVNASNFSGLGGVIDGIDIGAALGNAFEGVNGFESGLPQDAEYSNTSPSLGLIWDMSDQVQLTATWGESFLTPLSSQLYGTISAFPSAFSLIPFLPLGGQYSSPISVFGANPSLQPQTANTRTVRLAYSPSALDDLNMSVTYSELSYDNFIANAVFAVSTEQLVENFDRLPNIFVLGDTNTFLYDQREQNLSTNDSRTIDFLVDYRLSTDIGEWNIDLNAVRTLETNRQLVDFIPAVDLSDTEQGSSKWAGTVRLSWNYGNYDAAWETSFVSATRILEPATASTFLGNRFRVTDELPVVPLGEGQTRAGSYTTTNVQFGYTSDADSGWTQGLHVALGARNLFNPDAPFVDNFSGFAANRISQTGRVLYLNLKKEFRI